MSKEHSSRNYGLKKFGFVSISGNKAFAPRELGQVVCCNVPEYFATSYLYASSTPHKSYENNFPTILCSRTPQRSEENCYHPLPSDKKEGKNDERNCLENFKTPSSPMCSIIILACNNEKVCWLNGIIQGEAKTQVMGRKLVQ